VGLEQTDGVAIGLIILSGVALGVPTVSGWLGGQLAYRYGVRVAEESTQAEADQRRRPDLGRAGCSSAVRRRR
jgi:hypothetical protein